MLQRFIYILLLLFVVFLIWNDATGTGEIANAFLSRVGDALGASLEFIDALVGNAEGA